MVVNAGGSGKQEAGSFLPPKRKFFLKRFALGTLCTLALSLVLSGCGPDKPGNGPEEVYGGVTVSGAVTVSFDKNNSDVGSTEANPNNMSIRPPATTLGTLPTEPTRPGYKFVEWNTQSDGSGETFTEETPIQGKVHLMVYARWKPVLNAQLSTSTLTFSPMEEKLFFTLTLSGFKNEADANSVGLDTNIDELSWLSQSFEPNHASGDTKTFVLNISYQGEQFTEAPTTLKLTLKNLPAGYEYAGGTQTLHIATASGQKNNPIPVHQGNLKTFNDYARTQGVALHYQLIENVTLPAEQPNNWTAIGTEAAPFTGSFDGGGHSISGLNIDLPSGYQGLFGSIFGEEAVIKNLGLKDGSVSGSYYVGGVVGYNDGGKVQNCYAEGNVSSTGNDSSVGGVVGRNDGEVHNSHASGNVSSTGNDSSVGGVVGWNRGEVQNCYATGSISGSSDIGGVVGYNSGKVHSSYATDSSSISGSGAFVSVGGVVGYNYGGKVQNCYASGSVSGNSNDSSVGGVVGWNYGEVQNCYATGNVSASGDYSTVGGVVGYTYGGKVQNCYATGSVSGNGFGSSVGGVVGLNEDGIVQNCYATGNVSASGDYSSVGGVVGWNSGKVQNCYATGSVSGNGFGSSVGGVVGYTYEGIVQNCVALNPSVTLTPNDVVCALGRVTGIKAYSDAFLTNNYARDDMQLIFNGTPQNPSDKGDSGLDGADVPAEGYSDSPFWESLCSLDVTTDEEICWDFQNVWKWEEGLLPTLRNVGST